MTNPTNVQWTLEDVHAARRRGDVEAIVIARAQGLLDDLLTGKHTTRPVNEPWTEHDLSAAVAEGRHEDIVNARSQGLLDNLMQ